MTDQNELTKLDILLRRKQNRWEDARAIAMIVVAIAALGVAIGLGGWFHSPQTIIVRFEQPLAVKLVP